DAELMPDRVFVEQIFPKIVLAGAQHKTLRRHEGEMQALLGADRAVACGHHGEICGAFKAHHAAMAAAGVGPFVGHRSASFLTKARAPDDSVPSRYSLHSRVGPAISARSSIRARIANSTTNS